MFCAALERLTGNSYKRRKTSEARTEVPVAAATLGFRRSDREGKLGRTGKEAAEVAELAVATKPWKGVLQ